MDLWAQLKAFWAKVTNALKAKWLLEKVAVYWQNTKEFCSKNVDGIIFLCCLAFAVWIWRGWHITSQGDNVFSYLTGENPRTTFAQFVQGTVAVVGLLISVIALRFFASRVKNQEEQTASQIRKEIDERFSNAIALLGNDKTSVRTGAVYALYELAAENEKYLIQIAKILCGHIRAQTQSKEYQEVNAEFPSDDVQAAINVLFKREYEGDNMYGDDEKLLGLYMKFTGKLPRANLRRAYLVGADFYDADCRRTIFDGANCQKAWFRDANCRAARFIEANCQGADFAGANCEWASFENANCQGVNFDTAFCQQTKFWGAQCQGAAFINAQCERAIFEGAKLKGADFTDADTTCATGLDKEDDD